MILSDKLVTDRAETSIVRRMFVCDPVGKQPTNNAAGS